MPLSRPVLIAVAGAILAVAAFFATSASRQEAAVPKAEPPAKPAKPESAKATKAVEKASPAKPKAQKAAAKAKVEGVPVPVARALDNKRIVVLFFRQAGSADDRAVAIAVNAQRGRKNVSVFSDSIARLARYRAVIGGLGISQAPAVVIVGRNGKALVIEGFVDERTLTQQVIDAKGVK
jgi:hypothetical protein